MRYVIAIALMLAALVGCTPGYEQVNEADGYYEEGD